MYGHSRGGPVSACRQSHVDVSHIVIADPPSSELASIRTRGWTWTAIGSQSGAHRPHLHKSHGAHKLMPPRGRSARVHAPSRLGREAPACAALSLWVRMAPLPSAPQTQHPLASTPCRVSCDTTPSGRGAHTSTLTALQRAQGGTRKHERAVGPHAHTHAASARPPPRAKTTTRKRHAHHGTLPRGASCWACPAARVQLPLPASSHMPHAARVGRRIERSP